MYLCAILRSTFEAEKLDIKSSVDVFYVSWLSVADTEKNDFDGAMIILSLRSSFRVLSSLSRLTFTNNHT